MLDLDKKPFKGYVLLSQLGTPTIPNNDTNRKFVLICNYAIKLLNELDFNLDTLFGNIEKIINEVPHPKENIYNQSFWAADRIIDLLKRLLNLIDKLDSLDPAIILVKDSDLEKRIKNIRDNQIHLDEKLIIEELTSIFTLSYSDTNISFTVKLDSDFPHYNASLPQSDTPIEFKPNCLKFQIGETLIRRNTEAIGSSEVNFQEITTMIQTIYNYLEDQMHHYVNLYSICCPAPTQLSISTK